MAEPTSEPVRDESFYGPEGMPLELHVMRHEGRPPVLLLHGASAQHETFCIPRGRSLAEHLWREGYEPWLLDWRGSRVVTDALQSSGRLQQNRDVLDFDHAAREDLPAALEHIARVRDNEDEKQKIHIVAHCMGAGVVAQAIASGTVGLNRVGRVVLLTLGLFYESPLDGKVKSQFNVLDRLWKAGSVTVIDPRTPNNEDQWPPELGEIYEGIGTGWRPHPLADFKPLCSHALCNRVSFMYGAPYRHANLVQEIHGAAHVRFVKGKAQPERGERVRAVVRPEKGADDTADKRAKPLSARLANHHGLGFVSEVNLTRGSWQRGDAEGTLELSGSVGKYPSGFVLRADDREIGECDHQVGHDLPAQLKEQFGGIPLRMYLQGAQNLRRRWAGPFVDTTPGSANIQHDAEWIGPAALERFLSLPAVTLITGARNQLWHRDSIDRMYEWLTSGSRTATRKVRKHVVPGYAHQDLLWGVDAEEDVFPLIVEGGLGG